METIEQKTYRILQVANKKIVDNDLSDEIFLTACKNPFFKLHCKMLEIAIAEEREAIAEGLNILRMTFNNGEEFEGDDGMIACVDLAQWNEGHRIIMGMLGIE